jgi:hypothetical protein
VLIKTVNLQLKETDMRKLVLLVCMATSLLLFSTLAKGGVMPSWEAPSRRFGFFPISNEISFYKNVDDAGADRGQTMQIISINSFRILTSFNFEFTCDLNWRYSYLDPFNTALGKSHNDHYIEFSIVKPVTDFFSLNVQRITASFEDKPINQFGIRLSF